MGENEKENENVLVGIIRNLMAQNQMLMAKICDITDKYTMTMLGSLNQIASSITKAVENDQKKKSSTGSNMSTF